MVTKEESNEYTRDFYQYVADSNGKILPELFNNQVLKDGFPGLQAAVRFTMYDKDGSFIVERDDVDNFSFSGTYTNLNVNDGYVMTKSNGLFRLVYAASVTGLNTTAPNIAVVVENDGTIIAKNPASILETDTLLTMSSGGVVNDMRNLNKGDGKLSRSVYDLSVAGQLSGNGINLVIADNLNVPSIASTEYYCSTQAEITSALTAIGSGRGTIIITQDITLTGTITISGGANLVITSVSRATLTTNVGNSAFLITNCQSCLIENIRIDASGETSNATKIIEIRDTTAQFVTIDRCQIIGNSGSGANIWGVYIWNNAINTRVANCDFLYHARGFVTAGGYAGRITVENCRFTQMKAYDTETVVIVINTEGSMVKNNHITTASSPTGNDTVAIRADASADYSIISGNYINGISATTADTRGIWVRDLCARISVNGNLLRTLDVYSGSTNYVIAIDVAGQNCSIDNNIVEDIDLAGTGGGFSGLRVVGANADNNIISDNNVGSTMEIGGNFNAMNTCKCSALTVNGDNVSVVGNYIVADITITSATNGATVTGNRVGNDLFCDGDAAIISSNLAGDIDMQENGVASVVSGNRCTNIFIRGDTIAVTGNRVNGNLTIFATANLTTAGFNAVQNYIDNGTGTFDIFTPSGPANHDL